MSSGPLIDAAHLFARLGEPGCIVVDCRFDLADPDAGLRDYRAGHIPGARYAHLNRDLSRPAGPADGRHPLPDPADFSRRLGSWGISNADRVAVYDEGSSAMAARLWWMLRWVGHEHVAVLDGGFKAWQASGYPVEAGLPESAAAHYELRGVRQAWLVQGDDIPRLQEEGALLLDARSEARFRGRHEPIDPVAGHVPGARNFPFSENLTRDGRFRSATALREDYLRLLGGRDARQAIAMCGSGVTACHILLAMELAGLSGGRLYAGSWSEWLRDPRRPVAKDPEP